MDEEELQKRFTDCVYFLASPLTCKKGIECEYRHSEIARLNPRDCWYWLGGSCFNPDCAFRHPPLEAFKEAHCESADLRSNMTNVPCYFYANGFCNKGDKCSFLHGPADTTHAWNSSKAAPKVNNAIPSENKRSAGSITGSAPIENHPNQFETFQIEHTDTEIKPSRSAEKSESPDISATHFQETIVRSDSLFPHEEFVESESDVFTDQSSFEQADGYVEQEKWLESSPGFDVLVTGESERLGYEQDADYFPIDDEKGRKLDIRYVEYDYSDPIEYDPAYPELGNPERYDVYDRLDNIGKINGQSRKSIFYRLSFQEGNLQVEPKFDLRDRLKRRKVVNDSFRSCFYKRHDSPRLLDHRIRRNPRRREVGIDNRGRFRKAVPLNRYGQPRKLALQQKKSSREESATFTGPKSLDQIKEEKKALQHSDAFQGPRPLSEILKNKRKLGSVVDRYSNIK